MNARVTNLESEFVPLGTGGQELAVEDSVVALAALPDAATHAMLTVKTQPVHVAFSSDPVSAGAGNYLAVGTLVIWPKATLAKARFIRAGGSSGVVRCEPGVFC